VQQLKATEKRNVCLPDAEDVVPIADAPMRWHELSSNSECVMVVGAQGKGWGDMMAWRDKASNQAKPQQSGANLGFRTSPAAPNPSHFTWLLIIIFNLICSPTAVFSTGICVLCVQHMRLLGASMSYTVAGRTQADCEYILSLSD